MHLQQKGLKSSIDRAFDYISVCLPLDRKLRVCYTSVCVFIRKEIDMNQRRLVILIACSLFLFSMCISFAGERENDGDVYFTRTNIWFEKPDLIYSTNYHRGGIIPVASEVKIIAKSRGKIRFQLISDNSEYVLVQNIKHTTISFSEYFDTCFTRTDPTSTKEYKKFSKMEKENIKSGKIEVGMSKEAVLMAYGYPPSHQTPRLESNVWKYWRNRFVTDSIYFTDNKVSKIQSGA